MSESVDPAGRPGSEDRRRREGSLAIDLTGSEPPAEVLEQMAHADAINSRLRASGRQLCFALSADGCSLQIELRDIAGNVLRIVSAAEAVEIVDRAELA